MRYLIFMIVLLSCLSLTAQEFKISTPEGTVSMSITGVQKDGNTTSGNIIDQIAAKLDQLEKEVHTKLNKLDQKRAENILNEVYGLLALLPTNQTVNVGQSTSTTTTTTSTTTSSTGTVNINMNISGMDVEEKPKPAEKPKPEKPKPAPQEVQKPAKTVRVLMSEAEFNSLISKITAESFGDDKLRVLRTAVKNNKFNCSQVVRLIGAFTYSEEKLDALRISYPEVVDPQNNYKIIDAFTYSSDKQEAEGIINE